LALAGLPESWTNWAETVRCQPRAVVAPPPSDVAQAIARSRGEGSSVRPRGAGHSFVPLCATDGHLLGPGEMQGIVTIDRGAAQAKILSGTLIADLGEPLNRAGLALENQGDIDVQTLAGAIATGTHGTGLRLGNLSSQLAAITMVTAWGETLNLSRENDRRIFEAAGVSLGSLGVFLDLSLNLIPRYRLREENFIAEVDECCAAFPALQAALRNVEFFWLPEFDQCVVKSLVPSSQAVTSEERMDLPLPPPGTIERYLRPPRTHWSHRIYPSKRNVRFNEMEFAVPIERGIDCFRDIRELIRGEFREVRWAVEYRTVAADSFYLSQAYGSDRACISVHQDALSEFEPFFRASQEIFLSYGGRPHWGKTHFCDASTLATLYPRWEDFLSVRARLDPAGLFLNSYLRSLFGVDR